MCTIIPIIINLFHSPPMSHVVVTLNVAVQGVKVTQSRKIIIFLSTFLAYNNYSSIIFNSKNYASTLKFLVPTENPLPHITICIVLEVAPLPFKRLWNITVFAHDCDERPLTKEIEVGL